MWQFAPNGTLLPILLDCYEKNSSQWSFFWKKNLNLHRHSIMVTYKQHVINGRQWVRNDPI